VSDPHKYGNHPSNVTHVYVKKRTVKGIIIMKVMLEHKRAVCEIMSVLSQHCDTFRLCRLQSCPPGEERVVRRNLLLVLDPRISLDQDGDRLTERRIVHGCECSPFDTWLEGLEIALQYFVWNDL